MSRVLNHTHRAGRRFTALLFAGVILSGCQAFQRTTYEAASVPLAYTDRHPILFAEEPDKLDVFVGSGRRSISPGDRAAIINFANEYRRVGTGSMRIFVPSGSANETGAVAALRGIQKAIAKGGVNPASVTVSAYSFGDTKANGPIRIVYDRVTAVTAPCGQWPDDISGGFDNTDYYNYGCATQQNLAAVVADPRDLLRPRGAAPRDAARRDTVFDKYRRGEPTGTKKDSDNDANVASVE